MPKIIDHDQRRREIVEATEKLIVEGGFQAATMRQIATAAGYANGALKRYFTGKDEILEATSDHVIARLRQRLEEAVLERKGFDAVQSLCRALMPTTAANQDLGRMLITFWDHAANNSALMDSFRKKLRPWRQMLTEYLDQALAAGEICPELSPASVADELITFTVGLHVMCQVNCEPETISQQVEHLERRLETLRGPATLNQHKRPTLNDDQGAALRGSIVLQHHGGPIRDDITQDH